MYRLYLVCSTYRISFPFHYINTSVGINLALWNVIITNPHKLNALTPQLIYRESHLNMWVNFNEEVKNSGNKKLIILLYLWNIYMQYAHLIICVLIPNNVNFFNCLVFLLLKNDYKITDIISNSWSTQITRSWWLLFKAGNGVFLRYKC